jgi:hypothetical protein
VRRRQRFNALGNVDEDGGDRRQFGIGHHAIVGRLGVTPLPYNGFIAVRSGAA